MFCVAAFTEALLAATDNEDDVDADSRYSGGGEQDSFDVAAFTEALLEEGGRDSDDKAHFKTGKTPPNKGQ